MPTVGMRVYSGIFKSSFSYRFDRVNDIPSRIEPKKVSSNPAFVDGVASKDVIINEKSGLCVRIFLPQAAVQVSDMDHSTTSRNFPLLLDKLLCSQSFLRSSPHARWIAEGNR